MTRTIDLYQGKHLFLPEMLLSGGHLPTDTEGCTDGADARALLSR